MIDAFGVERDDLVSKALSAATLQHARGMANPRWKQVAHGAAIGTAAGAGVGAGTMIGARHETRVRQKKAKARVHAMLAAERRSPSFEKAFPGAARIGAAATRAKTAVAPIATGAKTRLNNGMIRASASPKVAGAVIGGAGGAGAGAGLAIGAHRRQKRF